MSLVSSASGGAPNSVPKWNIPYYAMKNIPYLLCYEKHCRFLTILFVRTDLSDLAVHLLQVETIRLIRRFLIGFLESISPPINNLIRRPHYSSKTPQFLVNLYDSREQNEKEANFLLLKEKYYKYHS
uniref:Uncharacterized protein n=1 Tax=Cacopsylla melanoneura TaxID=428564 RepID=A0A8D9E8H4_9HEMI